MFQAFAWFCSCQRNQWAARAEEVARSLQSRYCTEVNPCEFEAEKFLRGEERTETKTGVLVGKDITVTWLPRQQVGEERR